ncbi:tRNA-specific adenosine deaminase [Candidatus Providencia siddallii]|uniref:tRNA-specific adenosine deaminase n=1 Tax=Candidatus Providencia siddallii TaxID=1715285 RepID=A0A0M6W848_9GAMM|nr:tRNA-specific adenosine deaminase [Candidatus Providencia siddallii]
MTQIKIDKHWMTEAIKLAIKAKKLGEIPVGAILIKNDKLVAKNYNRSIIDNNPIAHAEMLVLQQAGKILKNYRLLNTTLYVTLQPCMMCQSAISNSRISRLVYGSKNNKLNFFASNIKTMKYFNLNQHINITEGILEKDCSIIINDFFKLRRSQNKKNKNNIVVL